jgi:hypothetical protein
LISRSRVGIDPTEMTARQGKIAVAITVAVLSVLLFQEGYADTNWPGFAVTEIQILVAMAISWWVLSREA